jgi:hypothetical protein
MIVSDIGAAVMTRLADEAGTNSFWNITTVKSDIVWLYRDTAKTLQNIKKRDASTTTVVGTKRYVIPISGNVDSVLKILNCSYDGEPVDYYETSGLDGLNYKWRSLSNGTPFGCYFEKGDENIAISLVPAPADTKELAIEFAYMPVSLADGDHPLEPFKDGTILFDGTMSLELAKAGGGRDLDRSDFWFNQFLSHFGNLTKHKGFSWRGFKSVEESSLNTRGVRLPSNYPRYSFDD